MTEVETLKALFDKGFHLIPLNQAKKPLVTWEQYQNNKKPDWVVISGWNNKFKPSLWAIICGDIVNHIVVVDFDDPNIYERYFRDIRTLTVRTPSGGMHLYVKSKAIPDKVQKLYGYALDIQGAKSYVVCPGSKNEKGTWEIINDATILEIEDALDFVTKRLPANLKKKYNGDIDRFKKDIKKKLTISDYITKHVTKVREGHGYWQGTCPFHSEKNPSFTVYEDSFYCFGCGEHGDIIDFIMKIEGVEFKDALKKLSELTGVKLPEMVMGKKKGMGSHDKPKTLSKSTVRINGILYEQVDTKKGYKFAYLDNGIVKYTEEISQDGITYVPCIDEEVIKRAVLFCSDVQDYGSIQDLIKRIDAFILKWLDISDLDRMFYAYYVLQTWVYENFHTIGYARALGDTGTGKTRFLDVVGGLCYKPIFTNGAIGAAPIFRIMDKHHGTLIIDEANFGKSDETQAIMTILNSGWEQGKPVLRCDKEHPEKINTFNPFGAKVLGTRKRFTDSALEARCYTVTLTQTDRADIPANLDDSFFAERLEITNRLLLFRLRNIDKIKPGHDMQKLFVGIEPRIIQKALPLASIIQDDEKALKEFIKYVRDSQEDLIDERQGTWEGTVALAVLELYEEKLSSEGFDSILISAEDITEELNKDLPDGKKTNSKKVGKILKVLGFSRKAKTTKKPLETNEKKRKTKRALETDHKLINKLLRRYTFLGDNTYDKLRQVVSSVSSVSSCNGEGDFNNNNSKKDHFDCSRESPLGHETHETHETESSQKDNLPVLPDLPENTTVYTHRGGSENTGKTGNSVTDLTLLIEQAGREWQQIKGTQINSTNITEFCLWYCEYRDSCRLPSEIRALADKVFNITPATREKTNPHYSYLCKIGQHKDCGGYACDCACHSQ